MTLPRAHSTPYSQTLPVMLMRAREAVADRFRPVFRAYDLTEQQWRVLRALAGAAEVDVMSLAKLVFLRGPSLSRILRDMTVRGLISRRTTPHDRRIGRISITSDGRALIAATAPEALEVGLEITRLFGESRLEQLQALLAELEAALTEAPSHQEDPLAATL